MSSYCSFKQKFPSTDCDIAIEQLNNFSNQEQTALLSEVGLIFSNLTANNRISICQNHLLSIQHVQKNRLRNKTCAIPELLNDHCCYTKTPRSKRTAISADRYLTADHILQINQSTGYVLPIGTRK